MRIGILSQFYDPEPGPASLPGVLARGLAARGHDIRVVTGFPNYPSGTLYPGYRIRPSLDEQVRGVPTRRTALIPSHDRRVTGRALNHISFGISSAALGVQFLRGADAVWVSNSPVAIAAMRRLRHWRIPMLLHVLDLWPDTLSASGFAQGFPFLSALTPSLRALVNSTYRAADVVATTSPGVGNLLEGRGVPGSKIKYIPLWADEEVFQPIDGSALRTRMGVADSTTVLLYAGALGWTQGIDSLVEALRCYPKSAAPLECWIVGSGVAEQKLRQLADQLPGSAPVVRFLGRMTPTETSQCMGAADVHYAGLRAHELSNTIMPSKVQATLATGKPLISAVGDDANAVVAAHGVGWTATPGDVEGIRAALVNAAEAGRPALASMGRRARLVYGSTYSVNVGVEKLEAVLNEIRILRR